MIKKISNNYNVNERNIKKNEIICVYEKEYEDESINLLYDYPTYNIPEEGEEEFLNEIKKNINEENKEIYINNKKIKFNYTYDGNEKGLINVKFKFK